LQSQVADLVNIAGVQESEIKMLSIDSLVTPVESDLDILIAEGSSGHDVPPDVLEKALDLLNSLMEFDVYWFRPLVLSRVCTPADPDQGFTSSWAIVDINPPQRLIPPTSMDPSGGFQTVFDPQLALPVFLKAVEYFLSTGALLNPTATAFTTFFTQFSPKIEQAADFLQDLYDGSISATSGTPRRDTLVDGLLSSRIPLPDELFIHIRNNIPGSVQGFAWAGFYGVIDIYGVYPEPLLAPTHATTHIVDMFMSTGISQLGDMLPVSTYYQDNLYPWFTVRLQLGIIARRKAVYTLRGYDKAWSILQKLRVITGQQGAELEDKNKNWSARELISLLGLPTSASDQVPGGRTKDNSLSDLVERLDQIARGTWDAAPDPWSVVLSRRKFGLTYDPANRPIGFRDRLSAAAA
jgi:hypothetical protein